MAAICWENKNLPNELVFLFSPYLELLKERKDMIVKFQDV